MSSQSGRPPRTRDRAKVTVWLIILGTVLSLLFVGTGSTGLLGSDSNGLLASSGSLSDPSDDVLYLHRDDAVFMSRIFQESSHEVAYCGLLNKNKRIKPWLADTIRAGSDHVELSTGNCPGGKPPALIHTHPSGSIGLSSQDRTHGQVKGYRYMCIQNGPITAMVGERASHIRCYERVSYPNNYGYEPVDIVLTDPSPATNPTGQSPFTA